MTMEIQAMLASATSSSTVMGEHWGSGPNAILSFTFGTKCSRNLEVEAQCQNISVECMSCA